MKKNRRMMKKNEKIEVKEEKGIWRYKGGQQIDLGRKKARTLNGYLYDMISFSSGFVLHSAIRRIA